MSPLRAINLVQRVSRVLVNLQGVPNRYRFHAQLQHRGEMIRGVANRRIGVCWCQLNYPILRENTAVHVAQDQGTCNSCLIPGL